MAKKGTVKKPVKEDECYGGLEEAGITKEKGRGKGPKKASFCTIGEQ